MRFLRHLASSRAAFALAALLLCGGLFGPLPSQAASPQLSADEYGLKAAFLYNLAKFIDWPAAKFTEEDCPLVIGVIGQEALERFSAVVRDKMIDKHKVTVRLLAGEEEIKTCHILFITRSQKQRVAEMVEAASKAAVLTVGETDKFLEAGGMIRFYLESDNLRLEINDPAIRSAGLSIKANALSALINKGIAKLRKV